MSVIIRSATGPCQQMTTTSNGYPWQDGDILDAADLNAAFAAAYNNVGRNLIHNPLFNIAQRGAGPFTTHNAYTADRWRIGTVLDTCSFVRYTSQAFANALGDDSAQNYLSNVFTGNAGAAANTYLDHPIEGVSRISGKTVTVSFWANASATLKLGVNMVQLFGTGGSPSAGAFVQPTGNAVTLSGILTRYSMTFVVPSLSGKTLGTNGNDHTLLRFTYTSGANNNQGAGNIGVQSGMINLWGVQLEIGTVATPLEKPDPRYDLSNCQRFFSTGQLNFVGYTNAGSTAAYLQSYPVTMRGLPIVTPTYTTQTGCTGGVTSWSDGNAVQVAVTATALGPFVLRGSFTASADL